MNREKCGVNFHIILCTSFFGGFLVSRMFFSSCGGLANCLSPAISKCVVLVQDSQLGSPQCWLFLINSFLQRCQMFQIVSLVYSLNLWNSFSYHNAINVEKMISTTLNFDFSILTFFILGDAGICHLASKSHWNIQVSSQVMIFPSIQSFHRFFWTNFAQTFVLFSLFCKIFLAVYLLAFTVSAIIPMSIQQSPCPISLILVPVCGVSQDVRHLQCSLGLWKTIIPFENTHMKYRIFTIDLFQQLVSLSQVFFLI